MKRKYAFLFSLVLPLFLLAQDSITINQLLSSPFPTDLQGDPDGDRWAWIFNEKGKRNIWTAGPSQKPQQHTRYQLDDGIEITNLQFVPGRNALLFVRGGVPNRSGEFPNPLSYTTTPQRKILLLNLDDNSVSELVVGADPRVRPNGGGFVFSHSGKIHYFDLETNKSQLWVDARGALRNYTWSPDGSQLAFVSNRGDHGFIGLFSPNNATVEWVAPSVDKDNHPVFSPDGKKLAFMRFPHQSGGWPFQPQREGLPWSIVVADLEQQENKTVWTAQPGQGSVYRSVSSAQQLHWTRNNHLVFPWEENGWTHLYAYTIDNQKTTCLTPGEFEVQFVSLGTDGNTILYSGNQSDIDRQHIWSVQLGVAPTQLTPKGSGVEWSPVMNGAGAIAGLRSTGVLPAAPYYIKAAGIEPMAPTTLPSDWPDQQLVAPQQVIFPAADGMNIHGQLFYPTNYDPDKKYPAVLFFHGGSRRQMLLGFHHRGYYHNAFAMNHYLAQQGYLVLSVNYRSGIGYGLDFREALNYGATGASEFNDVLGAGLFMQQRNDVDQNKIGLWGGSYGGYLTALGLARASDLFAAGVDIHGVHDWNKVIRNFRPAYREVEHPEFARLAFTSSPLNDIKTWRSPVLLIHGDDDRNVPFSESVELVEQLRYQQVHLEQLVFPDEVHGFLLHQNWIAAFEATADFFHRMLQKK